MIIYNYKGLPEQKPRNRNNAWMINAEFRRCFGLLGKRDKDWIDFLSFKILNLYYILREYELKRWMMGERCYDWRKNIKEMEKRCVSR